MRFNIGLHWLEFTMSTVTIPETLKELEIYASNDFAPAQASMYGYRDSLFGRAGIILLSDSRRSEHHVILPGRWLTEVGEKAVYLLGWIFDNKGSITRVDIACDDTLERPGPAELREYCNQGQLVTRFRRRNSLENHVDGSVTNYIGSMKSDRFLRVYDKTKETKGNIKATRWEIVFRNEYAQQACMHVLNNNVNYAFLASLNNMIDFREPSSQEERCSRRPRMKWYTDFLQGIDKAEYTRIEAHITLERMEHWLQKQVSRTLSTVVKKHHGDMEFVYDLIELGGTKTPRI